MKFKKALSTFMVAMFILSSMAIASVGAYTPPSPGTWMWVDDTAAHFTTSADLTGTEFDVPINIYNVTDMAGFEFKLSYNTTLLDAVTVTPGPEFGPTRVEKWLPEVAGVWTPIDEEAGIIYLMCLIKVGQYFNGSATLVTITFSIALAPPYGLPPPTEITYSCPLHLYDVEVSDKLGAVITTGTEDGTYSYTRTQIVPGAPVADFIWSPAIPYEGDTVTLTDTSSPNGGTITAWEWIVLGDATLTGPYDTKVTTMHCDGAGTAIVQLTVWDSEGMYDWVEKSITQLAVVGAIIDLYTSANRFCGQTTTGIGTGPNQPCDALSPDVNITLFAKVTWGGAPVMHSLVAFEVRWMEYIDWQIRGFTPVPKDECVLYRTAETDKDGVARIWFRVPTPCPGHMFGKWLAIADCKVQELKIEDRMNFDVGYLITLHDGEVTLNKAQYVRDQDVITVTFKGKNIAWMDKDVTFVVTVYDDCDVPIGQYIYMTTIGGGVYCTPNPFEIHIVDAISVTQWAYVGIGKVYVSAFTALPKDCGVAYCPEKSTTFIIKYVP